MAVISKLPDVDVSIIVNREPAQEHPVPGDIEECETTPPSTVCYIESQTGQNFFIRLTISPRREMSKENGITCRVVVDGRFIAGRIINRWSFPRATIEDVRGELVSGTVPEQCIQRFLTFSPVSTVEDVPPDVIQRDARCTKYLGTIKVLIASCVVGEEMTYRLRPRPSDSELVFAEKAMKGRELSHGTTFAHEAAFPTPKTLMTHNEVPLAVYFFRYRSRDALQKEMVIPRTPSPPRQSPRLADLDSMSEADVRLLAEQMLRIKRENEIKQEKEVKLEGACSSKRPIDLTDDDIIEVSGNRRLKIVKLEDGTDMVDLTE